MACVYRVRGAFNRPVSWGFCRPFAVQKGRGDAWVNLTLRPGSEPLFAKIEPSLAELEEAITPRVAGLPTFRTTIPPPYVLLKRGHPLQVQGCRLTHGGPGGRPAPP